MSVVRRCDHWTDGPGYCKSPQGIRYYLIGWRCPAHTPARLAGHEEDIPDPTRTLAGIRAAAGSAFHFNRNDTALNDDRAIASGRRRSTPEAYRAARAAEDERKAARHA